MPEILEPPASAETSMEGYRPDGANAAFGKPPVTPPQPAAKPNSPAQPSTPAERPQTPSKSDAAVESAAKKKSPMDSLSPIKRADAEPVEKSVVAVKPNEENLKVIREFYSTNKDRIKELEGYKPELETTRQELAKLKALGLNEEERKDFQKYREMNAVEAVRSSKEFQEKIIAPQQKRRDELANVCKHAKLNKTQESALLDAVDIDDPIERSLAIRSVLEAQTQDPDVNLTPAQFEILYNRASKSADDLKENLYPREDAALARAQEVQMASRAQQQQQEQQTAQQQKQEMDKAYVDVRKELSEGAFKVLLEDTELSVEGSTLKDAMDDYVPPANARERAAESMLAASAPFLIADANKWRTKYAELERANKARHGAAPSRADGATKPQDGKVETVDPKDVFQRRGSNYMGGSGGGFS